MMGSALGCGLGRVVGFVVGVVFVGGLGGAAGAASVGSGPLFRSDQVLVGFTAEASSAVTRTALSDVRGSEVRTLGSGAHVVRVPAGQVLAAVASLKANTNVRYAEPDYLQSESGTPNDPSFALQWGYQNTGQTVNGISGTAGADERVAPAWDVTTGTRSVVVAEVDSGIQYTHPDLAANIWSNPGGVGGCAAGTHGYNVRNTTCDPMDDETVYHGHGTHVAGIIGATGNNGAGVTGVNWQTTILPVKWLDSSGNGSTSDLIASLDWVLQAKQAGVNVRVVNDSATFVGTASSQALSDEIDLLGSNDILFVTAAGNTGQNNDDQAVGRYPCRYNLANEICVTASNQNDSLPSWANYGATTVDLAAPGDNIYSTLTANTYGTISGGSMASPQVAGAAALILSHTNMTTATLKNDILTNVDQLPTLTGLVRTNGRLNICKALPGCTTNTGPTTFVPAADAYVNASAPSANYGTNVALRTDASPVVRSYLRFNLTGLSGSVSKATLRVYANTGQAAGYDVFGVASNSWTEAGLTFSNAPALAGVKTGSSGAAVAKSWTSVDVTSLVSGNGLVSFGLVTSSSTALSLSSRQGANPPQLVVQTSGGGSPDTQAPSVPIAVLATPAGSSEIDVGWAASIDNVGVTGYHVFRDGSSTAAATVTAGTLFKDTGLAASSTHSYTVSAFDAVPNESLKSSPPASATTSSGGGGSTVTFAPVADSYIDSSQPAVNFGTNTAIRVDGSPTVRTYLKFTVTGLTGTVTSATLRVYANSAQTTGYDAFSVPDTSWTETGLTYNNAPALAATKTASSGPVSAGTWTTVTITPLITGNSTITIALTTTNTTALSLSSRQGTNPPQLVITTS